MVIKSKIFFHCHVLLAIIVEGVVDNKRRRCHLIEFRKTLPEMDGIAVGVLQVPIEKASGRRRTKRKEGGGPESSMGGQLARRQIESLERRRFERPG